MSSTILKIDLVWDLEKLKSTPKEWFQSSDNKLTIQDDKICIGDIQVAVVEKKIESSTTK